MAQLFDQYRQFHGQASDLDSAQTFLRARFDHGEFVLFIAAATGQPVGFAQLYPSYSSVSLKRAFVLNDLFVSAPGRRKNVATLLLAALEAYAGSLGATRITLNVVRLNVTAQALYEARDWKQDDAFIMYHRYPASSP